MTNHIQALLAKIKSRIADLEIDARNARIDNWEDDYERINAQIEVLWCLHSEINLAHKSLEQLQSECEQEAKELGKYNGGVRWNERKGQVEAYEWMVDEIGGTMDAIAEYHAPSINCEFCDILTNQYEIETAQEMLAEHGDGGDMDEPCCCHCAQKLIDDFLEMLAGINEWKTEFTSQGC